MPGGSSISLSQRILSCWPLKLLLLVALTLGFCGPYLFLSHNAYFPVRNLPLLAIDRWAGLHLGWVWVYQSVYLITGTLPWLATSRQQLRRYLVSFALLVGVCFVFFLFLPVAAPRPTGPPTGWMHALLLSYDGPYNAFPSLHAGFLYLTLAFARRVYGPPPRIVTAVFLTWAGLILWSTLATKQHYVLDLVAGIAVAVLADAAAWRNTDRSTGPNSHDGLR